MKGFDREAKKTLNFYTSLFDVYELNHEALVYRSFNLKIEYL